MVSHDTRATTRRAVLRSGAVALAGAAAGCLGRGGTAGGATPAETGTPQRSGTPPTSADDRHLPWRTERLRTEIVSGGVGTDDIPSIDDPAFEAADDVGDRLAGEDPVFGVVVDGEARAYPQSILVWHEICNDVVADVPVTVTYCPLTGTAMGFYRGGTTFGVSGRLVNSNLVMYDRATESRWPQVLATAISGDHEGEQLAEFPVAWTTWEDWRDAHPDTRVLTADTGYARDYGRDPYGGYAPRSGYYQEDYTMFEPLSSDDRLGVKDVVFGARTADRAVAVTADRLADDGVVAVDGDPPVVVVHDPALGTGHAYLNPDGVAFERDGSDVAGPNGTHAPDALPLERLTTVRAMWFAWAGFYPEVTLRD